MVLNVGHLIQNKGVMSLKELIEELLTECVDIAEYLTPLVLKINPSFGKLTIVDRIDMLESINNVLAVLEDLKGTINRLRQEGEFTRRGTTDKLKRD